MEISELKGPGPKSVTELASVGISTIDDLLQTDAYEIYKRLKNHSPDISLNMIYAIIGTQESTHWQEIAKNRKAEILMRLDDMGLAPKQE